MAKRSMNMADFYRLDPRYCDSTKEGDPERATKDMWCAVILRALADYFYLSPGLSGHDRAWEKNLRQRWHDEAEAWLMDDRVAVNSFMGICGALGIDADSIRAQVFRGEKDRLRERIKRLNSPDPLDGGQACQRSRTCGNSERAHLKTKMKKMATYQAGGQGTEIAHGGN